MPTHDAFQRRRTKRTGREKGCWLYVPAESLVAAGIDPEGPPPFYRVWAGTRGSTIIRFYREG